MYPVPQVACRAPLRTSFWGKQSKTTHALTGVPTNGTSVKTSASWNPFAQNSNTAGIVGSQGRDDYEAEDVEYYFNYSKETRSLDARARARVVCVVSPRLLFLLLSLFHLPPVVGVVLQIFTDAVRAPCCLLTCLLACFFISRLGLVFFGSLLILRRCMLRRVQTRVETLPAVGILADEGSNDRMDALVASGKHPIDIILLFAAAEASVSTHRSSTVINGHHRCIFALFALFALHSACVRFS